MNLAHRMHRLGLLSDWQVRSTYIQLGKLGYRDGEPGGIERERSQILAKVFAALRTEGLSRREIARQLAIPVDELNRSTFGLTLAPAAGGPQHGAGSDAPPSGGPPALRVVF
jgi:hypothetical protein